MRWLRFGEGVRVSGLIVAGLRHGAPEVSLVGWSLNPCLPAASAVAASNKESAAAVLAVGVDVRAHSEERADDRGERAEQDRQDRAGELGGEVAADRVDP